MRDDVDALEEVVERDERVVQHKDGFGNAQRVGEVVASSFGLKVADAVVADVADRASCFIPPCQFCRSFVAEMVLDGADLSGVVLQGL